MATAKVIQAALGYLGAVRLTRVLGSHGRGWFLLGVCLASGVGMLSVARGDDAAFTQEQLDFFERKVRPVLVEKCYSCHSHESEKLKGNLLLDSRADALKGGDTGPAITPGNPAKSLLVEAIAYANTEMQMPPKKRLDPAAVADLTRWVEMGAPWPVEKGPRKLSKIGFDLQKRKRAHWCWQPVTNVAPPAVRGTTWPRTPVDYFVLAGLEKRGLKPATAADRRTLIRRLSFDLLGLPPTPGEVEAYVSDTSDNATEDLVDRLLASPHFGERWARHWMDLVRYAETRGHEFDPDIPNAWQYRDYLVRALNQDVRYDQFAMEHIAGDLIPPRLNPKTGANEAILGTGFWFLGEEVHSPVDIRQDETERIDNRLDVMGKAFLGLTLGCARCHDHKFDAISQKDYYSMAGFLVSSSYRQARFETLESHREIARELEKLRDEIGPRVAASVAQAELTGMPDAVRYLLAARDVLAGGKVDDVAPLQSLSVSLLSQWVDELKRAQSEPAHPLRFPVATQEGSTNSGASSADINCVIDYAQVDSAKWITDGYSFGLRPLRPGEPLFGLSVDYPLRGIASMAGAYRDPLWNGLSVQGSQRDPYQLGGWERSEMTLKTPDFALATPRLWYLIKGSGRAYAVVNSHLMVMGPLHGALLHEWKAEPNQWTWVEHGLHDYVGHRLHVEFSPVGTNELVVAQVVQADKVPPLPSWAGVASDSKFEAMSTQAAHDWAAGISNRWSAIAHGLIRGVGEAGRWNPSDSPMADWMIRNLDLFCPKGSTPRLSLAAEVQPILQRQSGIAARIRNNSATAPAMFEGSGIDEFVLIRGSGRQPGAVAPRRFLEAIAGTNQAPINRGSGRLELARHVVDPSNPLTARVMVNRVWHHLFGRGIVPTVDNFGVLGQVPSHPDLLDFLARRFVHDQGWSVKALIRELVLSQTYQMSSRPTDELAEQTDPENVLLHRMNVRRLEGEAIRDAILSVSGRLQPSIGGPSVPVYLTPFMEGRGRPGSSGPLDGDGRRSLYMAVRRNFLPPMMLAFDAPIPFNSMGRRNISNVPAQALILMNDPFVVEEAARWAKREMVRQDAAERVQEMYHEAFSRPADETELAAAGEFIRDQAKRYGLSAPDEKVWADFAHVLFNVKEFIYLN